MIQQGEVYIKRSGDKDFIKLKEWYLNETNMGSTYVGISWYRKEYKVPPDSYFLMWDNRMNSTDSRMCFRTCVMDNPKNFITKKDVVGRVLLDFWYFDIRTFSFWHPKNDISTKPKFFSSPSSYNYDSLK